MNALGAALTQSLLENDMKKIFYAFDSWAPVEIYPSIDRGQYSDEKTLYNDMAKIVYMYGRQEDLLELMPFIDEYIELALASANEAQGPTGVVS
jgi:hypothetical protein